MTWDDTAQSALCGSRWVVLVGLNPKDSSSHRNGESCGPAKSVPLIGEFTMLIDAVGIDDPVVYCEHKYLYYHLKADALPKSKMPIGQARIVRPGRDLTIVSYSAMLHEALAVAKQFGAEGYEIEVIDLRTVKPLDTKTVLASVARTGRLLCVGASRHGQT